MFADKRRETAIPEGRILLGSLIKNRLAEAVKWLATPPAPLRESPVWEAGPAIDPTDFSEQLSRLQRSLHGANAVRVDPQITVRVRIDS